MIDVNIYTNDRYFQVKPKGLVITRRYEENEYAFVASDVKFDCFGVQDLNDSMFDDPRNRNLFEAKELYDAIFSGAEVFCVIIKNDAKIFYGIFQRDGTSFDPESLVYSFTILHIIKKVFEVAKAKLEIERIKNPAPFQSIKFDVVINNYLHNDEICVVNMVKNDFEFTNTKAVASPQSNDGKVYETIVTNNPNYSVRDYWIDFAKQFRAIFYCNDAPLNNGGIVLNVVPRKKYNVLHQGYDNFIAGYKEEQKNAQYANVYFPCYLTINLRSDAGHQGGTGYYTCYVSYDGKQPILEARISPSQGKASDYTFDWFKYIPFYIRDVAEDAEITLPDNTLDLRVPSGCYAKNLPFAIWNNNPFNTIPTFTFNEDGYQWSGESPRQYCERQFPFTVTPYKECEVFYSESLPVNPYENIAVEGTALKIYEIEDDLMNETSKVIGRMR